MPRGTSIHIGLNFVDPDRYDGWDGQLSGCINDARDMQNIANGLGYTSTIMTDSQATAANVMRAIGQAAQSLSSGDILMLTYSGHGSQVRDANGEEPDGLDETWVLWDRMLLDDELFSLWSQFRAGVRIVMLSDSCHSGTVARMRAYDRMLAGDALAAQYRRQRNRPPKFRLAPPEVVEAVYERDRALYYEPAQWASVSERSQMTASLILISGCQDNQLSADGERNGLFTETLLSVWSSGSFQGNYAAFHTAITDQMPATQTPNLFRIGAANAAFDNEKPFTIGDGAGTGPVVTTRPTITAPGQVANSATPVRFSVNPGAGRYYAVEVTTDPTLFNFAQNGSRRDADNFFGSWATPPFGSAASYPADYAMPSDAWERLRRAGATLYYRVWATDSPNSWANAISSTPDSQAASAPSFSLTGGATQPSGRPTIEATSQSFAPGGAPPSFLVNPGAGRRYAVEVTTNPYYFMYDRYGGGRNDDNFFASWKTPPFLAAATYPARYEMPSAAFERLARSSARLYYRVWGTDSADAWVNALTSTPDANALEARSFAVGRAMEAAAAAEQAAAQVGAA